MDIQKALADIKAEKERRYVNCARLAHAIARATGEKRSDLERRLAEQHGILVGLAIAQNKLRRCAKQSTNGADGGSGAAEGGGAVTGDNAGAGTDTGDSNASPEKGAESATEGDTQ